MINTGSFETIGKGERTKYKSGTGAQPTPGTPKLGMTRKGG